MLRIFIRDLRLNIVIGVYSHEKLAPQEIIINLEAVVRQPENWRSDDLNNVVDYGEVAEKIRAIAAKHSPVKLLETFASLISEELMKDKRITELTITIEKPAIFPDARSAGITACFSDSDS